MSGRPRKQILVRLAVGTALFVTLAFASRRLQALSRIENDNKAGGTEASPALQVEKSRAEGECCNAGEQCGDSCCSQTESKCFCGSNVFAKDGPTEAIVVALEQEKGKDDKAMMMKASPAAMAKGETARKAITDHQKALAKDGVYGCCIKPGCTFCSSAGDMCPCAMNLQMGDPVCPECWGGWIAGHGRLKGVDASKVQVIPKSKLKMMYDMKAMNFQKAGGDGSSTK
jgi:hypothetical protein